MKIRTGFVSNSSSASFVIKLVDITADQLCQIDRHCYAAKTNNWEEFNIQDPWDIVIDNAAGTVSGYTLMDNFGMLNFLLKIGVPEDKIEWDKD